MNLRSIIFYVSDIDKSKEFYQKLGFEVDQEFGNYVSYKSSSPKISFAINLADDDTKVPGKQVCSVYSHDMKNDLKLLEEASIEVFDYKETSFGKTFHIRDLDGNKINYVQE